VKENYLFIIYFTLLYFILFYFDTELLDLPWYYNNKHITSTNLGLVVTLAASTLTQLFCRNVEPFFFFSKKQNFVNENKESIGIFRNF
jgi:hypothetical protein